jgi:hypothetical protein
LEIPRGDTAAIPCAVGGAAMPCVVAGADMPCAVGASNSDAPPRRRGSGESGAGGMGGDGLLDEVA